MNPKKAFSSFKRYIKASPAIYFSFTRYRTRPADGKPRQVTTTTDLLIDGYPRSGNTFATYAFLSAQDEGLVVAHHFHAVAAVKKAVNLKVPVLIAIRDPEAAIASRVVHSAISNHQAALEYINYYEELRGLKAQVVMADFETIISDFGKAIDAVNKRFGRRFKRYMHSDSSAASVMNTVEKVHHYVDNRRSRFPFSTRGNSALRIPAPHHEKTSKIEAVKESLRIGSDKKLLDQAYEVYFDTKMRSV